MINTNITIKHFLIFILHLFLFSSCSVDEQSGDIRLRHNFSHSLEEKRSNATLGIWMFKEQSLILDAVANWTTQENLGLLEPINVIWIDYSSSNEQDAYQNVINYLIAQNFQSETGSVEFPQNSGTYYPKHTTGYFGYYDGIFKSQLPTDVTWVDNLWPDENNHGRIFPSYNAGRDNPVYYTLGSFSREGSALNIPPHPFISFNNAQSALIEDPIPDEWEYEKMDTNWGNIISTDDHNTADHSGVAILVRYKPPDISGLWYFTNTGTITISGGGQSDTQDINGTGTLNINQDGQNVSWVEPSTNTLRSGTFNGTNIQVSGDFIVPLAEGVVIIENLYEAEGTISQDGNTINLNGNGTAKFIYEGVTFSVEGNDEAVFFRTEPLNKEVPPSPKIVNYKKLIKIVNSISTF